MVSYGGNKIATLLCLWKLSEYIHTDILKSPTFSDIFLSDELYIQ